MARNEFKVGDRVRVYSHYGPYDGTVDQTDFESKNRYRTTKGLLLIRSDAGELWGQHPKQCRRLKPKKRREVWLYPIATPLGGTRWETCTKCDGAILFREVFDTQKAKDL